MNRLQLIGRLGQDPRTKQLQNGTQAVELFVATTEPAWTNDQGRQIPERTTWHNVTVWGRAAKPVAQYLKKGDKVYVEGTLHSNTVEREGGKTTYWNVDATSVEFLSKPAALVQASATAQQNVAQQAPPPIYAPAPTASELPLSFPPDFSH